MMISPNMTRRAPDRAASIPARAGFPTAVRIGSRGSELALWQARRVAERIRALGVDAAIVIIKTTGDIDQRTAFGEMPDKGVFVKEIEEALLARRIDLAVHSLKDLPTDLPEGLSLAAVPERETPLDAFISHAGCPLAELAPGTRVATGSLRRQAQVLALRPDLVVGPIRGNVPRRLNRVRHGEVGATLLAAAGLRRLGLADRVTEILPAERMTPAMGQGALGIEARTGEWPALFAALDDPLARRAVDAERHFLARVGGGCKTPAGILVEPVDAVAPAADSSGRIWRVTAMLASADGAHLLRRSEVTAPGGDPARLALSLAEQLLALAPPEISALLRAAHPRPRRDS